MGGFHSNQVLVVGAGLAGLGAATTLARLGASFRIVERESTAGGLLCTDEINGFTFDRAGHFLHFRTAEFEQAISASGVPIMKMPRSSAIILHNSIIPYPLQFNLWAAPAALREAVLEEIENLIKEPRLRGIDLESALSSIWGETLVKTFFRPYTEKMWRRPLASLPWDCGSRFLPEPNYDLVKKGISERIYNYGYNASFCYPTSGRIGDLAEALADKHQGHIGYGLCAGEIDLWGRRRRVNGDWINYSNAIMTDPLPTVLAAAGMKLPDGVCFDVCNVLNVRVGFEGAMVCKDHWHYVPDPEVPFFRVGYPANVVPNCCPTGCASLSLEICAETPEALCGADTLAKNALNYLESKGIIKWRTIRAIGIHRITPAYTAYRSTGRAEFKVIFETLAAAGVIMAGRYGEWDYFSAEDAWVSGTRAARRALLAKVTPWSQGYSGEMVP